MTENTKHGIDKSNLFSFLYRTRVKIFKGDIPILNLSLLFCLLSLLSAAWLVVIGSIAGLLLGYRFEMEKNSPDFGGSFRNMVQGAAGNMKSAVDSFAGSKDEETAD